MTEIIVELNKLTKAAIQVTLNKHLAAIDEFYNTVLIPAAKKAACRGYTVLQFSAGPWKEFMEKFTSENREEEKDIRELIRKALDKKLRDEGFTSISVMNSSITINWAEIENKSNIPQSTAVLKDKGE